MDWKKTEQNKTTHNNDSRQLLWQSEALPIRQSERIFSTLDLVGFGMIGGGWFGCSASARRQTIGRTCASTGTGDSVKIGSASDRLSSSGSRPD